MTGTSFTSCEFMRMIDPLPKSFSIFSITAFSTLSLSGFACTFSAIGLCVIICLNRFQFHSARVVREGRGGSSYPSSLLSPGPFGPVFSRSEYGFVVSVLCAALLRSVCSARRYDPAFPLHPHTFGRSRENGRNRPAGGAKTTAASPHPAPAPASFPRKREFDRPRVQITVRIGAPVLCRRVADGGFPKAAFPIQIAFRAAAPPVQDGSRSAVVEPAPDLHPFAPHGIEPLAQLPCRVADRSPDGTLQRGGGDTMFDRAVLGPFLCVQRTGAAEESDAGYDPQTVHDNPIYMNRESAGSGFSCPPCRISFRSALRRR